MHQPPHVAQFLADVAAIDGHRGCVVRQHERFQVKGNRVARIVLRFVDFAAQQGCGRVRLQLIRLGQVFRCRVIVFLLAFDRAAKIIKSDAQTKLALLPIGERHAVRLLGDRQFLHPIEHPGDVADGAGKAGVVALFLQQIHHHQHNVAVLRFDGD